MPGLYYTDNRLVMGGVKNDVTYLTQTPGCDCRFVGKNEGVPVGGQVVRFGVYGVGRSMQRSGDFGLNVAVVGKVDEGLDLLVFYDEFMFVERNTSDYQRLICAPVDGSVTTMTPAAVTTAQADETIAGINGLIEKSRGLRVNIHELNHTIYLELSSLAEAAGTPVDDAEILRQMVIILITNQQPNDPTPTEPTPARRKRQTATTCTDAVAKEKELKNEIAAVQRDIAYAKKMFNEIVEQFRKKPQMMLPADKAVLANQFFTYFSGLQETLKQLQAKQGGLKDTRFALCVALCGHTDDIVDGNGNYVTSTCHIGTGAPQNNAAAACKGIGMTLFTMSSASEALAFIQKANSHFGYGAVIWVSGMKGLQWVDTNDGVTPIDTSFFSAELVSSGSCAAIGYFGSEATFDIVNWDCNGAISYYCEYSKV
jgi:hypothetical protein